MMNSPHVLPVDHQAFLNRFISACQSDPRILAAFLHGSHARGAADPWSDLDIGVVTTDETHDDFLAGRAAFAGQLGEPLFLESFDNPRYLFFIMADGVEGELLMERESDFTAPHGHWQALVDKTGLLARVPAHPQPDAAGQVETLRRAITWFWHDLSHFITAMGRNQLWWAAGQLEILRRCAVDLVRLRRDIADTEAGSDTYFKLDTVVPPAGMAALRATFCPQEYAPLLIAARVIIGFFRELAVPLAQRYGIRYPVELDELMMARLRRLDDALPL